MKTDANAVFRVKPGSDTAFWLLVCCLSVIIILPIIFTQNPPLQDYPSHLARIHILTNINDPAIDKFYDAAWEFRPNLGLEMVMLGLSKFVSIENSGRIFLAFAMIMLGTAPVVLHLALWRGVSPTALFGFPLVFNLALQKGFLSFLLGAGLAIWAYALWITMREISWKLRSVATLFVSTFLLICHLHAFGVFSLAVVGTVFFSLPRGSSIFVRLSHVSVAALPLALPLAVLWILSPTSEAGFGITYLPPRDMIWNVLTPMTLDPNPFSLTIWALCFTPLLLAFMRGGPVIHPLTKAPMFILLACAVFLPFAIFGSYNANWRIFIPFSALLVGAVTPALHGTQARRLMTRVALCTTLAATAWCLWAWRNGDAIAEELDHVTAQVPAESRLFPVILEGGYMDSNRPPSFFRIAERSAHKGIFVPSILADPRHQPIKLEDSVEPFRTSLGRIYYGKDRDWKLDWSLVENTMDYVLLIHTQESRFDSVPKLPASSEVIDVARRFVLYKVVTDQKDKKFYRAGKAVGFEFGR